MYISLSTGLPTSTLNSARKAKSNDLACPLLRQAVGSDRWNGFFGSQYRESTMLR